MKPLSEECEFDHYIQSLRSSSNRVRYIILTLAVTTILIFFGAKNSHFSWTRERFETTKLAIEVKKHLNDERCKKLGVDFQPAQFFPSELARKDVEALRHAAAFACATRLKDLESYLKTYFRLDAEYVARITVPILGLSFDANDLGLIGGAAFALLFALLVLSLAKEYQNLRLCLWKVRDIAKGGEGKDEREALLKANFLYHALVMAQLINHPPTLPRRDPKGFAHLLVRTLLVVPFVLETWIFFWLDLPSRTVGTAMSPMGTYVVLVVEALSCIFILGCTVLCLIYSRAGTKNWRRTFVAINPPSPADAAEKSFLGRVRRVVTDWAAYVELIPRPDEPRVPNGEGRGGEAGGG